MNDFLDENLNQIMLCDNFNIEMGKIKDPDYMLNKLTIAKEKFDFIEELIQEQVISRRPVAEMAYFNEEQEEVYEQLRGILDE